MIWVLTSFFAGFAVGAIAMMILVLRVESYGYQRHKE